MYRLSRTQTILNQNDAVNVILHNDKHIELGVRVVIGYGVPAIDGNFPRCRKHQGARCVEDAEKRLSIERDNRDKVRALPCVITSS